MIFLYLGLGMLFGLFSSIILDDVRTSIKMSNDFTEFIYNINDDSIFLLGLCFIILGIIFILD